MTLDAQKTMNYGNRFSGYQCYLENTRFRTSVVWRYINTYRDSPSIPISFPTSANMRILLLLCLALPAGRDFKTYWHYHFYNLTVWTSRLNIWTSGQTDGRTEGRTDGPMNQWMNGWTDWRTDKHNCNCWMDGFDWEFGPHMVLWALWFIRKNSQILNFF